MKIAIIGAGIAGLTLAQALSKSHTVTVIEKARGPGGRMSTRRAGEFAFDHGAQYFTAATREFQDFLAPFIASGRVAEWPGDIDLRGGASVSDKAKFAAVPSMNAICKSLLSGLDIRLGQHVETLIRDDERWHLQDVSGAREGPFDWVISTAPAPQTANLFPKAFCDQAQLDKVRMRGCFAVMLGFDVPLALDWQALKSASPPIGWMAVNSNKPGRAEATSIIVQSSNEWADEHLSDDPHRIQQTLLDAASALAGCELSTASHQAFHRWRYAATAVPAGQPFLRDDDLRLAACGDWCLGGKVEAAFLSADALAKALA